MSHSPGNGAEYAMGSCVADAGTAWQAAIALLTILTKRVRRITKDEHLDGAFDRSKTKKATAAKQVDHQSQQGSSTTGDRVGDALDRAATHHDHIRVGGNVGQRDGDDDGPNPVIADKMTIEEVLALPAAVPLALACRALNIGVTKGYRLAREGGFPVPLKPVGNAKYRAPKTAILKYLGIQDIPAADRGRRVELESRPALDALAEVLDAIPDAITRYAAYTLLARLIELGSAERTEPRT